MSKSSEGGTNQSQPSTSSQHQSTPTADQIQSIKLVISNNDRDRKSLPQQLHCFGKRRMSQPIQLSRLFPRRRSSQSQEGRQSKRRPLEWSPRKGNWRQHHCSNVWSSIGQSHSVCTCQSELCCFRPRGTQEGNTR